MDEEEHMRKSGAKVGAVRPAVLCGTWQIDVTAARTVQADSAFANNIGKTCKLATFHFSQKIVQKTYGKRGLILTVDTRTVAEFLFKLM
jgi:hypothetical protein